MQSVCMIEDGSAKYPSGVADSTVVSLITEPIFGVYCYWLVTERETVWLTASAPEPPIAVTTTT